MSRSQRLAEILRAEVANLLLTKVRDKRLGFVTLTRVDVSNDLSAAKIYYSVLDIKNYDVLKAQQAMNAMAGFMRREIGQRIETRIVPHLQFIYDDSIARGVAMVHRIHEIAKQDEAAHQDNNATDQKV